MSKCNTINVGVLAALVPSATTKDDLSTFVDFDAGHNSELVAALVEIRESERKNKVLAAAEEIQKLVATAQEEIQNSVSSIRAHREAERKLLSRLSDINRATAYGYDTMNFLPLVTALTSGVGPTVPSDWVDAKKPVKKMAVKKA